MQLGPATTRTLVPIVVAAIVNALATIGFSLTEDGEKILASVVAAAIGLAYYVLARIVESVYPAAGFLLGNPKKPEYLQATPFDPEDAPEDDVDDEDDEPLLDEDADAPEQVSIGRHASG